MNTTRHAAQTPAVSDPTPAVAGPVVSGPARQALAVLRLGFGLTFLWAFFDKLLALGFATGRTVDPATGAETVDRFGDAAWINGGSPTEGFLAFGAEGAVRRLLQLHRRRGLGRLAVHAGPARHRDRADARHRDAARRPPPARSSTS